MYLRIDEKPASRVAVVEDSGHSYTYGDLAAFTEEFAQWLSERTMVMVLCRNCMATIAFHIAAVENHVVPFMCSSQMDAALRDSLIEQYQPEYLWIPEAMQAEFPAFAPVREKYGYVLLVTGYPAPEMYEDLSMLLTTSGSTGSPKLVRHRYRNLYANAENVAAVFNFGPDDRSLIDLQLHYTMGLNVATSSLYAGATLAMVTSNVMKAEYWKFFEEQHITNITGVPYSYDILKRLRFFRKDHPDLRILAEGGGKLTDEMFLELAEYAQRYGKQFFATFGTSETTARLAFLDPKEALNRIGSIGKAIPHGELLLAEDDGSFIETMEATGEMVYKGENVTLGYALCKEDLKKGDERHGIYYTGDMARRDADGYFYIVGRKSRFLKLYGYRVGLDESERLIKNEFDIPCACVGSDERMDIYILDANEDKAQDIRKFISEKTRISISAFKVVTVDSIPQNEVGKILYNRLPVV